MEADTLRIVVVDNLRINRNGTRSVLESIPGVDVVACYDFPEALAVSDWSDVDWVVSDIALESAGPDEESAPIVPLVQRIRSLHPRPAPWILAVTSNPKAFTSPLMLRRLVEADSDIGLVWRPRLDERLNDEQTTAKTLAKWFYDADPPDAPDEIPELGIFHDTKVNQAIEMGRALLGRLRAHTGRIPQWTFRERVRIDALTRLRPATKEGNTPAVAETSSIRLHERLQVEARLDDPASVASPQRKRPAE